VIDKPQPRHKSIVALALTSAAGCTDIVGYLSLYHTFTAHMTGNSVHLGNYLFDRNFEEAKLAGTVLIAFICGSLLGRGLIEMAARKKIRSVATWTLAIEAALLAIVATNFFHLSLDARDLLQYQTPLALMAAAMGMQTATITRVGPLTVHTTFVTGMINKLGQLISQALFDTYDVAVATPGSGERSVLHRKQTLLKAMFMFSIWCAYVAGAVAGTWLHVRWQLRALYAPVGLLCGAIAADQIFPLSIEEEKDQAER